MTNAVQHVEQGAAVAPAKSETVNIIHVISQAASNPAVDVEKMERLLAMQERILDRQSEAAFNTAMNACQQELPAVVKKADNSHTKSKYAKLEAVDDAIRPVFTKHGFSITFDSPAVTAEGKFVRVTCECRHRDGFKRSYELAGELDAAGSQGKANKTGIQALGSTVSYLRRYLTCMIFNVVLKDEDRDGNQEPRLITATQEKALLDALGGPGERVGEFCKKYELGKLSDMWAENFDPAMAVIRKANAAREAKAA